MKKLYVLIFSFLTFSVSSQTINEFEPNPVGTDPANVSFELKGTPNVSFSGWILSVESDGANGIVDRAASVSGTFDSQGLLVVSIPDLENPSYTVILTSDFTGTVGTTDIDANDDGTVDDTSSLGTIYDALGIPDRVEDEASLYGADLGGEDFAYTGDEPGLVFRDGNTGDWYAVNDPAGEDVYDIAANAIAASSFDTDPTTGSTFGSANPQNSGTASVNEDKIAGFSIYPNPVTDGNLFIKSADDGDKQIEIFDVLGKKVFAKRISKNFANIASLKSGVYILRVTENNKTAVRKLVIK